MLSKLLSALGLAPKTLDQAHATLTEARATLDSVNALFAAAGLNLEQLLAAGPESLKAHLDSLDDSEAFAEALLENENLSAQVAALTTARDALTAQLAAFGQISTALGITLTADTKPEAIAAAFDQHVSLATTRELAKTGVPPVPNAPAEPAPTKTDAELAAEYAALPLGNARIAFFTKHEAALRRAAAR
jgi:hypothetical protein